jgi:hypothetical protein
MWRWGLLLAALGVLLLLLLRRPAHPPGEPAARRRARQAGWVALALGLAALAAAWFRRRGRGGPDTRPPDTHDLFR